MALHLHGQFSNPHEKMPQRDRRRTLTLAQRVHPPYPWYPGRARPLPQTWKMCLRTGRNRLPGCHCRTRHAKDGPKKDTRSGGLVPTDHCHWSMTIPRIHRVLPILHPELFKNHLTPPRSHKENDPMALGWASVQGLQNPKNPNVSKTRTSPTKLCKTFLSPNWCLCIWRGCHTLASSRH